MRPQELALLYLIAGLLVGVTLHRQGRPSWLSALLWPLALPGMLADPHERFETAPPLLQVPEDQTPAPIARLQTALKLLDVGTDVTPLGRGVVDLRERLAALDRLRAEPDLRPDNQRALDELRERLATEHQLALDRIDDLVTTIHLAHYGGRSLDQLDDQLADLLAMVQGVAEVQWIP